MIEDLFSILPPETSNVAVMDAPEPEASIPMDFVPETTQEESVGYSAPEAENDEEDAPEAVNEETEEVLTPASSLVIDLEQMDIPEPIVANENNLEEDSPFENLRFTDPDQTDIMDEMTRMESFNDHHRDMSRDMRGYTSDCF